MERDEHSELNVAISVVDSVGDETLELAADYAELGLDRLMDGALEQVPFVGTLLKITKGALGVREWLFTKKVLRFLRGAGERTEVRTQFALRLSDRKQRARVGEGLLMLLDKVDDFVKADMLGRLFARYLFDEIDEATMMEAARRLGSLEIEDLRRLSATELVADLEEDARWRLSNAGVVGGPSGAGGYGAGRITWQGTEKTSLGQLLLECLDEGNATRSAEG